MKSKTSFFNGTLFRSVTARFWPLWIAYLLILFGTLPTRFSVKYPEANQLLADGDLLIGSWAPLVLLAAAMAAVTAMCVFGHLYNSRQTALMANLPVKREAVFLSCFTAGLTSMVVCNVLAVLVCGIVEAQCGVLNLSILLLLLVSMVMLDIAFYGFAAFCAMLTGSVIVLPLVYLVLEVVAFVVKMLIDFLLSVLLYGYTSRDLQTFLSPLVALMTSCSLRWVSGQSTAIAIANWNLATVGAYCAVGIVFALLGLWLYKRRSMETTGEIVAIKILRPVFRWCMALGCGLVFAVIFCTLHYRGLYHVSEYIGGTSTMITTAVIAVLGCAVGWFGAEMLMQKTARVFGKKWLGFCLAAAILVCGLICAGTDITGFEKRNPASEDIAGVSVRIGSSDIYVEDAETLRLVEDLQQQLIEGKPSHAQAARDERFYSSTLYLNYVRHDGRLIRRSYELYDPEVFPSMSGEIEALEAVMNSAPAYEARALQLPVTDNTLVDCSVYYPGLPGDKTEAYAPPQRDSADPYAEQDYVTFGKTLDRTQAAALYDAIREDLEQRRIGCFSAFGDDPSQETGIEVCFYLCEDKMQERENPEITEYKTYDVLTISESTLAWLRENLDIG